MLPFCATLCQPAQRSAVGEAPLRDARADRLRPPLNHIEDVAGVEWAGSELLVSPADGANVVRVQLDP